MNAWIAVINAQICALFMREYRVPEDDYLSQGWADRTAKIHANLAVSVDVCRWEGACPANALALFVVDWLGVLATVCEPFWVQASKVAFHTGAPKLWRTGKLRMLCCTLLGPELLCDHVSGIGALFAFRPAVDCWLVVCSASPVEKYDEIVLLPMSTRYRCL